LLQMTCHFLFIAVNILHVLYFGLQAARPVGEHPKGLGHLSCRCLQPSRLSRSCAATQIWCAFLYSFRSCAATLIWCAFFSFFRTCAKQNWDQTGNFPMHMLSVTFLNV
jgi:hypothetical protein